MKKFTLSMVLLAIIAFTGRAYAQDDFTQGSNYYLIYLDDETTGTIPTASIAKDYRVDDTNNFLYVWSDTYSAVTATGPNWNGEIGEFINFQVNKVGWSGFGFSSKAASPMDLSGVTSDYTLHLAMKSTGTVTHCISLGGSGGLSARAAIGSTAFVDGANSYTPYTNFTRDGQWHLVEIPMSYFMNLGLRYPETFTDNIFSFLSGGVEGTTIALDAIFIYKKGTTGVNDVEAKKLSVLVTNSTISIPDATQPIELYSIAGSKVKSTNETVMGVEDVQKGIYIVRCGALAQKVQIK
jgi:hypothetical protein